MASNDIIGTIILIIGILLLGVYFIGSLIGSDGNTTDVVSGYESGLWWNVAYLTNDHSTAYCYSDINKELFESYFDASIGRNQKLVVNYEDVWYRGLLCNWQVKTAYETVVVTGVRLQDEP